MVAAKYDQALADRLRQPLRFAHSAIQLQPMFLLHDEVGQAASLFASKFADILRRRVILYGPDPFSAVSIPREAEILQLKRQLMNLSLRLRSGRPAALQTSVAPSRSLSAGVDCGSAAFAPSGWPHRPRKRKNGLRVRKRKRAWGKSPRPPFETFLTASCKP